LNNFSLPPRPFINITVFHVTSLAYAKARKIIFTGTQFGLASGPLALLTYKTDVFTAMAEIFKAYLCLQVIRLTTRSLTLS